MTEKHLIVSQIESAWQFSIAGSITAPFKSREAAIEAAIDEARKRDDPEIAVVVQDQDMIEEIIWRTENG